MKKVLVIVNLFHASPRIPGLSAYFSEFGWETTIVTPPINEAERTRLGFPNKFLKNARIIEATYQGDVLWFWRKIFKFLGFKKNESLTEQIKESVGTTYRKSLINRLLYLYQAIFGYPDTEKTWIKPALKAVRKLLAEKKFDAILSSSPYPASHMIAQKLKREFNIPWVADFRDPWSQNHDYPYPKWRKRLDEKLELKIIKSANAIVAASPGYANKQSKFHNREVGVITNGFDPETIPFEKTALSKKFTISYTGMIYEDKQDPQKILAALKDLIKGNKIIADKIELRFYGKKHAWLDEEIKKFNLQNIATQYGPIPKEESVKRQIESQILLLLGWEDLSETGVYPQKVFEYLAAERPILITGGSKNEDVKKLVAEANAGASAITVEEIKKKLIELYNDYKQNGFVRYGGDPKKIEQYSYRSMAQKFTEILNKIAR